MNFKLSKIGALLLASTITSAAFAGGFQLTEQSAQSLGRSYAGAGVDGTDLSGVYYNPASMTLHKGTSVQLGAVGIGLNLDYADRDGFSNNGRGQEELVPSGYLVSQINDSMWFGLGITVPFGMSTDYGNTWQHADHGTNASIQVIDFNPNFAWKINDMVSFGAGLSLQYVTAKLGLGDAAKAHADLKADNYAWGYNFGIMISPAENLRFGLSYRSAITHNARGTLNLNVPALGAIGTGLNLPTAFSFDDASAEVDAPAWVMANAAWDVNDKLSLYTSFRWTNWKSFDKLEIESAKMTAGLTNLAGQIGQAGNGAGAALIQGLAAMKTVHNNWKNTFLSSAGFDYRFNDFWTFRAGLAYETSVIDNEKLRTAIIPDADRWWFSLGSSFKWTKSFQTDVAFAHLHGVHERSLYSATDGSELGQFRRMDAFLIGVQGQYKF